MMTTGTRLPGLENRGVLSLRDPFGRTLDYLRLSVTDRCNLRCHYCMPPSGLPLDRREAILSWEEMLRLCGVLCDHGVRKIRLTGGEPLTRKGVFRFLEDLRKLPHDPELHLTTNGTRLRDHLDDLKSLGLDRLNVSLDSLIPETYARITHRDSFPRVWEAIHAADDFGFRLKLNVVVLGGINDDEIPSFVELTKDRPWTVRFIEAMPFNGRGGLPESRVDGDEILRRIRGSYPLNLEHRESSGVATTFRVPGHRGEIGIIFAHSRRFCGDCSRLRISSTGEVRTCLYGKPVLSLRDLLRQNVTDAAISDALARAVRGRFRDGKIAETAEGTLQRDSMAQIGG